MQQVHLVSDMPLKSQLLRLPKLPPPVLTAYIDVNPANPRNQGSPRGYIGWLKSSGQALSNYLPRSARREFRAQLARIATFLEMERPRGRGVAVFAGPDVWEVVPLKVDVTDELHWGKPSLHQMTWLFDEHDLRGAVVVHGSGARFFRFWLGTVTEDEAAVFSVDKSSWRKPHLVGPSTSVIAKQSGVHRDRVRDRISAQRRRFIRSLAERIAKWRREQGVGEIFLVGASEDIEAIAKALPAEIRKRTTLVNERLQQFSTGDLRKSLRAILERQEREYEHEVVANLIAGEHSGRAATGLDRALAEIQNGRAREIVVAQEIEPLMLRECEKCGWIDRSAGATCAMCGSRRRSRTLRTVLPELSIRHGIPIEVVAGRAAALLRKAGGIGVRLRTGARRSGADNRAKPSRGEEKRFAP